MGLSLSTPKHSKEKSIVSKVISNLKDVPQTHELPNGDNFGGVILRKFCVQKKYPAYDDLKFVKQIISEQKELADAFKKEGIPVRYFISEKRVGSQIFATDIGKLVEVNNKAMFISANFLSEHRIGEELAANLLMEGKLGIPVKELTDITGRELKIEGGDVRQMPGYDVWFIGGGFNTGIAMYKTPEEGLIDVCNAFAKKTGKVVIPINLKDETYYHLDCCFLPLERDQYGKPWAVIYEGEKDLPTMDKKSLDIIKKLYGEEHLIKITKSEAENFATNSVVIENTKKEKCIFTPKDSFHEETKKKLRKLGYKLIEVSYNEIHSAEGSIRCTCQEVPKSLVKDIMKPQDDIRVHHIKKVLKRVNRNIVFDRYNDDFILKCD